MNNFYSQGSSTYKSQLEKELNSKIEKLKIDTTISSKEKAKKISSLKREYKLKIKKINFLNF